jgi:23S rRNA pseudouridine1911/1915/1917 synthase
VKRAISVVVTADAEGKRLDRFLASVFPGVPPRSVRYALERSEVRVDGRVAPKGRILSGGERIDVAALAEAEDWLPVPSPLPGASVLYSDGHLVVLDKPPHVHTEPHRPCERDTLAGYLLYRFPSVLSVSSSPGLTLATRLDRETSGAVLGALTAEGAARLARDRGAGTIRKAYACVVEGVVESEATLDSLIEAEGGERVRVRRGRRDADPARWTRIVPVGPAGAGRTLVRAEIRKGRRHQIRAHLAAEGWAIVGDGIYGTVPASGAGADRLLLHAASVTFRRVDGGEVTVDSPLPPSFLPPLT